MRYMVESNFVHVVGTIWLPPVTAAYEYTLNRSDVENIGEFTRENVSAWLATHAGDFQTIQDFYATVGDKEIPWATREGQRAYLDCMFPSEEG